MPAILIIIPCFLESYEDFDQPKKKREEPCREGKPMSVSGRAGA
jgi:hypothetical protein